MIFIRKTQIPLLWHLLLEGVHISVSSLLQPLEVHFMFPKYLAG